MRMNCFLCLLLLTSVVYAADGVLPKLTLYRSGEKELAAGKQAVIANWGTELLKSSNFNTANKPEMQTIGEIQRHYRQTVAGDYLVISYNLPLTVQTVGGKVELLEIVVGLNRPDEFPSALFTIDPQGRVVAHEMYGGILPAELRGGTPATRIAG
jgi:hypothetical protein